MHAALNGSMFLVKEHVGMFKVAKNYDIYDPQTKEVILHCRESRVGILTSLFRFTDYRRMTPFHIEVSTPGGEPVLSVRRGVSLFLSKVSVLDENGSLIGGFKQKLFSIGGAFEVQDSAGKALCQLKGKWTGWDFRFLAGTSELAHVTKKWSGLGKELFRQFSFDCGLHRNVTIPPMLATLP